MESWVCHKNLGSPQGRKINRFLQNVCYMDKDNTGELELEDMKESEYYSAISQPCVASGFPESECLWYGRLGKRNGAVGAPSAPSANNL